MKRLLLTVIHCAAGMLLFAQATVSTALDTAAFSFTDDLIFDANGNLFAADYSGDKVYKRTPAGDVSVFISGLNTPNGLAFDSNGNLFVCDNIGNRIYKVDPNGNFLDTIAVTYPSGIIRDAASDTMIFTTYGAENSLRKLAPDGNIIPFHSGGALDGPVGLDYCNGILYAANFNDRRIFRVESDTLVEIAQLPGSGNLGFIACAGSYLYATAFQGHKIFRVDPLTQTVVQYAGSIGGYLDGTLDTARFSTPNGIVATSDGDTLYISEYNTGRLRMISGLTLATPALPDENALSVWPVPATTELHIELKGLHESATVHFVTPDGKSAKDAVLTPGPHTVDLSGLTAGIYFVQVIDQERVISTRRIVLQDSY